MSKRASVQVLDAIDWRGPTTPRAALSAPPRDRNPAAAHR
jgi:hypothetical protein